MRNGVAALAAFTIVLLLSSCSGGDDRETVLVMAASSLTDAFIGIETAFEAANPEIDVQLNLAGSASLREQIVQGAPADVFASANASTMQAVVDAGAANTSTPFAGNTLQIAVPLGNPANVSDIADLADPDLLVGLCGEQVPCGQFARQALDQAGVVASIDTNEGDVRALVTKLEAGELDAGIVYATDVIASPEIEGIALPANTDVAITYPIAVLTDSPNPDLARTFFDFVLSAPGQALLADAGFIAP